MIAFGNLLLAIGSLLDGLITIFVILLIGRAILSWVNPDPNNFIVQLINGTTEPLLVKIREKVPPLGMFDLSFLLVFFGLIFLQQFVAQSLLDYGSAYVKQGKVTVGASEI